MRHEPVPRIEEHRLQEQARLDALKTAVERNLWGQFATPPQLARSITRYALSLMNGVPVRFLDPAVGTGSFFSALRQESGGHEVESAVGIELDPLFAKSADALWGASGLQVILGDFTRQPRPARRFSLVLANPPYVRHHHLPAAEKDRLKSLLSQSLHLDISGLAGLYCYFLLLCHDWMEDDGLGVWLVPSEFMDVNSGVTLRRYLTERVTLVHIHRFLPTDMQFTDALVSSAIVIFRKAPAPSGHQVRFSFGGSIEAPQTESLVPLDSLSRSRKWTQFPAHVAAEFNNEPTLGDLFSIKRGLATCANDFFILSEAEASEWEIPREFLKPILPSPRYLGADVITALPGGSPEVYPRQFLLDCDEPEEKIAAAWPRFHEYLQKGRAQNIHSAYLASHRVPWYSQEKRPPAPFLCTYMGRARNGKSPFRFIWNRSVATAHNVYLLLYPKGELRNALGRHPELEGEIFHALQRLTPAQMVSEGRVYGGGLHKVEPKELAQIPAHLLIERLGDNVKIQRQATLFS